VAGVFVAGDILHLVYGRPDFTTAGVVFGLALWQMVIAGVTLVLGQVLYAGFRERLALRIVAIDTAAMVLLGALLIEMLGLLGAALTSFAVASLEFAQHYRPVARLLPELSLFRVLAAPFAAAGCALVLVAAVGQIGLLLPFLVAALAYVAALLAFGAWRAGGARALAREGRDLWTA
jgi:O-antigen/teichoic acid export membrane protein